MTDINNDDTKVTEYRNMNEGEQPMGIFKQDPYDDTLSYTFDDAMEKIGFGWYQIILMQLCGAGWMFDAIELKLISFVIPQLTRQWGLTTFQNGLLGSSAFAGMMIGAYFGGILSDKFGRKNVFVGSIGISTIFGLFSAFAPEFYSYLLMRFLIGIGLGASIPIDFSLFMEFIPTKGRGTLMIFLNVYWSIGSCIESLLAMALLPTGGMDPTNEWRWLVGISSLPGIFIFFCRLMIPESPRYLMVSGQTNKAFQILKQVAHYNGTEPPKGRLIFKETRQSPTKTSFFLLFSKPLIVTTFLLWIIWFTMSMGGWGISFITPIVFDKLGDENVFLNTFYVSFVGGLGYLICTAIGEIFPRKFLMSVTFFIYGVITLLTAISTNIAWMVVMCMLGSFISSFPWAIIYLYTPEVYPTVLRTTGMGTASLFSRIAGTITPLIGELLLQHGAQYPFLFFGSVLMITAICCCLLPVETRGRNLLDEIEVKRTSMDEEESEPMIVNDTI